MTIDKSHSNQKKSHQPQAVLSLMIDHRSRYANETLAIAFFR
ncbi:hypothetical protein [Moorena bouillonii]|nr:hypothetical protein [Moorena bouillonii]